MDNTDFLNKLTDIELLARLIYGEARGEGQDGQEAVAAVALNRAAQPGWWGNNLREVILKPYQFSCFNVDYRDRIITPSESTWSDCLFQAMEAIEHRCFDWFVDPTGGASHYFADSIEPPSWAADMVHTVTIGRHLFFRAK